jgi:hypothetical protein
MGAFYSRGSFLQRQNQIELTIYVADKVFKDWSNLNDVESDTEQECRDIYRTINDSVRWKNIGRVESVAYTKFIERGGDEVAGHQMTIQFLLRDIGGVCGMPMGDYDFDQATGGCLPSFVENSDQTYDVEVASGDTLVLPDITVTDSDGSTFTSPSAINVTCSPCVPISATVQNSDASYDVQVDGGDTLVLPDSNVNVNSALEGTVVSVKAVDIEVETLSGATVTPNSVTVSGQTVTIVTPAPIGAELMKTAQTVSHATGDDGDLETGRDVDFFTLSGNNPFGNTNRFTDELGGQTYTNNIVIDWSTYDGNTVLGWYRTANLVNIEWGDAITEALATSIGTFVTGWRLPNVNELWSLMNFSSERPFDWSPIDLGIITYAYWASTNTATLGFRVFNAVATIVNSTAKTTKASMRFIPCRTFTVTGTTLS